MLLMEEAERIAREEHFSQKILVIAGMAVPSTRNVACRGRGWY